MGQLEAALLAAKRDYELLRIEFERTVASNEQAAPIAKELQVRIVKLIAYDNSTSLLPISCNICISKCIIITLMWVFSLFPR